MIEPRGWCKVLACICPSFIVVGDFGSVDRMGPIEEEVEFVTFRICEGVDSNVGVGGVVCKLLVHPIKGATSDVVLGTGTQLCHCWRWLLCWLRICSLARRNVVKWRNMIVGGGC